MANTTRSHKAQMVIDRLGKKLNRQIVGSLVACVHCGMCTDACHYVLANPGDPTYAPAYKADQIRKFFKRHYDWTGRVLPWWVKAKSLYTDEQLEELKDTVFGKCTNCRRCSINCPMGVDYATFNRMARGLLVSVGVMPEGVAVVSKDQWEIGNQMGVLKEDYLDTLEWLSDEMKEEYGDPNAIIPIDREDVDVVYSINPREAKYDPRTISDAALIFYQAGENWTMPSEGWDMTNFGLFSGDDDLGGAVARRLYEKVEELRGKKLVISECGHGYRSTRCEGQNWGGVDINFEMESSVITMLRYIRDGRIKVDKSKNKTPVTFHDSCNNARSCGLYEEPRELLQLVCEDFREMYPNRSENYCCTGGGGAMSMSEYTPRRLKSAKIKADQLTATGAEIVVTSCHNCVDGLNDLIKHYKLGMPVTQLVNLVANALVIEKKVVEVVPEIPEVAEVGDLAGYKILVTDDEPDFVIFASAILEDNGATVLQAHSGDEAVEIARREMPDLMTLDLSMPGMSGSDVFEVMRNDPELKSIPVCIITGQPELRKLIYDRHVQPPDGYVDKPINEEHLLLSVRRILELAHEKKVSGKKK
ncbi:MAG: response regulator [candidate division Zixibacteria bacterium]|nr:response regulator [candidate division Zixibacteria bacterium]MBU1469801.1 response regulator [candidate division Zixibacteria bacterium]MBU2625373.1 response regulator [candidate division Zixibacteria bacterium]